MPFGESVEDDIRELRTGEGLTRGRLARATKLREALNAPGQEYEALIAILDDLASTTEGITNTKVMTLRATLNVDTYFIPGEGRVEPQNLTDRQLYHAMHVVNRDHTTVKKYESDAIAELVEAIKNATPPERKLLRYLGEVIDGKFIGPPDIWDHRNPWVDDSRHKGFDLNAAILTVPDDGPVDVVIHINFHGTKPERAWSATESRLMDLCVGIGATEEIVSTHGDGSGWFVFHRWENAQPGHYLAVGWRF